MCGRYSLAVDPEVLVEEFGVGWPDGLEPRYNIAPTQPVAVITNGEPTRVRMHHFGLIPHWAKERSIGARMINARRETVADKPAFRDAFRSRRCLVLADGYYEWQRREEGKQPYHIRLRSHRPFGFAGLWALWRSPSGERVPSCAIITAPAEGAVAGVHDRMPVIVPPPLRGRWLDPEPRSMEELGPVLEATPVDELELRAVGTYVSSPANEGPACIAPAPPSPSRGSGR